MPSPPGKEGSQRIKRPPFTSRIVPVMKLPAGDARNSTAWATSSAWPLRPRGVCLRYSSMRSGVLNRSWCRVSMTPGHDGVDAHGGSQFAGQGPGHHLQRPLGGGIGAGPARAAGLHREGEDVDDGPALLPQVRDGAAGREEGRIDVHGERLPPQRGGAVGQGRAGQRRAGVVDQDIEPPEPRGDRIDGGRCAGFVGEVALDEEAVAGQCGEGGSGFVGAGVVMETDAGPSGGEGQGDGAANADTGPGDKSDASCKDVHVSLDSRSVGRSLPNVWKRSAHKRGTGCQTPLGRHRQNAPLSWFEIMAMARWLAFLLTVERKPDTR